MARAKADKLESARRVDAMYRQLLDGWSAAAIVEDSRVQYGIAPAMAYRYLERAWQRIRDEGAPARSAHHARAVSAAYAMLRECESVAERLKVWRQLAQLLGLYAPKGYELTLPEDTAIRFTHGDEDIRPPSAALLKQAAVEDSGEAVTRAADGAFVVDVDKLTDAQLEALRLGANLADVLPSLVKMVAREGQKSGR